MSGVQEAEDGLHFKHTILVPLEIHFLITQNHLIVMLDPNQQTFVILRENKNA